MRSQNPSSIVHTFKQGLPIFLTLILLFNFIACATPSSDDPGEETDESGEVTQNEDDTDEADATSPVSDEIVYPSPEEEGGAAQSQTRKLPDTGNFVVQYFTPQNPQYNGIKALLEESKVLEGIAEGLNKEVALPVNISLSARECNMVNAFYQPQDKQLTLCYELVEEFGRLYQQIEGQSREEFVMGIFSALILVLYHEIGHALIDVLDIKTPGRPEDVVDQLAVFMLISKGREQGVRMALRGARYFALSASERGGRAIAFWDEHSTDETRFYNIYCWIYGSDRQKYSPLVDSGSLPAQRAPKCSEEYLQLSEGWQRLLEPHLKH